MMTGRERRGEERAGADLGRLVSIIPVGALEGAKSRLGGSLDAEERQDLVRYLLDRTIGAVQGSAAIEQVAVVSPDRSVLSVAARSGAALVEQVGTGLNEGLEQAVRWAVESGASAVLILAADLPSVSPEAIHEVVATAAAAVQPGRGLVLVVPDRHGRGTNALLLSPPEVIRPSFGEDSRAAHETAAREAGALSIELDGPLGLDLDLPADLTLAEELGLLDPARGG
jgi:2-phospho-L-lactate/phosphoenolpyruvate guanylyltransferase